MIDPATNTVTGSPLAVGASPLGVAVNPGGNVYVANRGGDTVSVINPAINTVTGSIPVGTGPYGVAVNPGGNIYLTNQFSNTVSVIDPATNTVTGSPQQHGVGDRPGHQHRHRLPHPRRTRPDRGRGQPRHRRGLRHQLSRRHGVGDHLRAGALGVFGGHMIVGRRRVSAYRNR